VVTTWQGGKAGGWCQFQWPQSRGSLPPPPTRGCCWTGTHTQTDASRLQSQSQSCLGEDDRWCQRLHQLNTVVTVIIQMRCSSAEVAMQSCATLKAGAALVPAARHVQQLTTSLQENRCVIIAYSRIIASSLSQCTHASV